MFGCGRFAKAEVMLAGIERMQMIRTGHFELAGIRADAAVAWEAVLSA
jgi:hypothetical protein